MPLAQKIFKKYNIPVYYAYDAKDYEEIYRQADLVISHRVHGCGISSSLGIPSICISHDERGETARGFLSEFITHNTPIEKVCQIIEATSSNICKKNQEIINHKKDTFNSYLSFLKDEKTLLDKPHYNQNIKINYLTLPLPLLPENNHKYPPRKQYSKWFIRLLCCFIPKQKNRKRLRKKYIRKL